MQRFVVCSVVILTAEVELAHALSTQNTLQCEHRFHDNKKLKQGHFEMGIRCANFTPISNRCARKRATLCPLTKCYQNTLMGNLISRLILISTR